MTQRWGLFIDVGWLFAAGSTFAFGETIPRKDLEWTPGDLIGALVDVARDLVPKDAELLRTYWYDGAPNRLPVGIQMDVARLPDVKVRLGRSSPHGQKGVDGLIIHDLITHAYRQTLGDAVLISGDEDLLDAIESAQANGTRVHLLEIPVGGIADAIYRAVDRTGTLSKQLWEEQLSAPGYTPAVRTPSLQEPAPQDSDAGAESDIVDSVPPAAGRQNQLPPPRVRPGWMNDSSASERAAEIKARHEQVRSSASEFAKRWLEDHTDDDYLELMASRPYLANGLDGELLRHTANGDWLDDGERRTMRDEFWRTLAAWSTAS